MKEILTQFNWWSLLDICLIAVVIYYLLLLIKGTKSAQMLTGLMILFVIFWGSSIVPLTTVKWVMSKFYSSLILILIIIFQEDIRLALSRIGTRSLISNNETLSSNHILDEITKAVETLSKKRFGALIVMEKDIILSRYIDIGIQIDGRISKELLLSIFHPSSPIHDGAVIIQQGSIAAAGCFLPLTKSTDLNRDWGTRHRAAIGISQETDAVVILVSEETKNISLVFDGQVFTLTEKENLRKLLKKHLIDSQTGIHAPSPLFAKLGKDLKKMGE